MSTVKEHLGLLLKLREKLGAKQIDLLFQFQSSMLTSVHLDELVTLAGGAELEDWALKQFGPLPADSEGGEPA